MIVDDIDSHVHDGASWYRSTTLYQQIRAFSWFLWLTQSNSEIFFTGDSAYCSGCSATLYQTSLQCATNHSKRKDCHKVFPVCEVISVNMVDDKVEMNNDSENYTTANANDPKNVQELTQYVRIFQNQHNLDSANVKFVEWHFQTLNCFIVGAGPTANNSRQIPKHVRTDPSAHRRDGNPNRWSGKKHRGPDDTGWRGGPRKVNVLYNLYLAII